MQPSPALILTPTAKTPAKPLAALPRFHLLPGAPHLASNAWRCGRRSRLSAAPLLRFEYVPHPHARPFDGPPAFVTREPDIQGMGRQNGELRHGSGGPVHDGCMSERCPGLVFCKLRLLSTSSPVIFCEAASARLLTGGRFTGGLGPDARATVTPGRPQRVPKPR